MESTKASTIPEWALKTFPENSYDLTMFDAGGDSIEEVELTRAEYIALKRHLAAMRGYELPEDGKGEAA